MIKPLLDYILIAPISEEKTEAGIYRPESAKERPSKGRVLEVGPGDPEHKSVTFRYSTDIPTNQDDRNDNPTLIDSHSIKGIQNNDTVYFKKYNAHELERDTWAVQAKDVIAVIKDDLPTLSADPGQFKELTYKGKPVVTDDPPRAERWTYDEKGNKIVEDITEERGRGPTALPFMPWPI